MAAPTVADLLARFPVFTPVPGVLLAAILAEAVAEVGDGWLEADRNRATLYLAAHMLATEGYGTGGGEASGEAVTGPVKRRKVGDVETEFAGVGNAALSGTSALAALSGTAYGRSYLRLMKLNFPTARVV